MRPPMAVLECFRLKGPALRFFSYGIPQVICVTAARTTTTHYRLAEGKSWQET